MKAYEKYLVGDTVKFTWINSGVSMSPTMEVFTGSETVIDTGTFIDSQTGHYYYLFTGPAKGYDRLKATGATGGKNYIRGLVVKGVTGEVD